LIAMTGRPDEDEDRTDPSLDNGDAARQVAYVTGMTPEAAEAFAAAVRLWEAADAADPDELARSRLSWARALDAAGAKTKAREVATTARATPGISADMLGEIERWIAR
jgi:hypothetical protein